jgi:hypothetical protein
MAPLPLFFCYVAEVGLELSSSCVSLPNAGTVELYHSYPAPFSFSAGRQLCIGLKAWKTRSLLPAVM